jgi:hypothetical protein
MPNAVIITRKANYFAAFFAQRAFCAADILVRPCRSRENLPQLTVLEQTDSVGPQARQGS